MKFFIFLAIFSLALVALQAAPPDGDIGGPANYPNDPEVPDLICPVGQQLVQVPTLECDMKRCRGDPPPKYCQFSSETLMACRCISGHYDHGSCVERCPRYPRAPPSSPPGRKNPRVPELSLAE